MCNCARANSPEGKFPFSRKGETKNENNEKRIIMMNNNDNMNKNNAIDKVHFIHGDYMWPVTPPMLVIFTRLRAFHISNAILKWSIMWSN